MVSSESPSSDVLEEIEYVPNCETSTVCSNVYSIELFPSSGPATVSVTISLEPSGLVISKVTSKSYCVAPPKFVIITVTDSALDNSSPELGEVISETPISFGFK